MNDTELEYDTHTPCVLGERADSPPDENPYSGFDAEERAEALKQKIEDEVFHVEQCCLGNRRDVRRHGSTRELVVTDEVMSYINEEDEALRALIAAVLAPEQNVYAIERAAQSLVNRAVRAFAIARVG